MKKQEQFFVTSSKNAGARGSDCRFNCFRNNQSALGAMLFERGGGARNQPSSSKAPPTTTINNNNDISASNGTTTNANSQRVDDKSVEKIVGGVNSKYHLVRTIGRGAHGQVYKGIEATTKKVVAIKEISLAGVLENDLTLVTGEVDLLSSLRHENVVRYIEAIREDQHLYIVLEYCENGSLASALKSISSNLGGGFGPFPESLAAVYVYHVL